MKLIIILLTLSIESYYNVRHKRQASQPQRSPCRLQRSLVQLHPLNSAADTLIENAEWLWRTNDWGATEGINIVTFKSKPRYTTGEIQTVACAMSATKPEEAKCFESAWGKTTLEALANLHAELEESVGRAIEFHHGTSDLGMSMIGEDIASWADHQQQNTSRIVRCALPTRLGR